MTKLLLKTFYDFLIHHFKNVKSHVFKSERKRKIRILEHWRVDAVFYDQRNKRSCKLGSIKCKFVDTFTSLFVVYIVNLPFCGECNSFVVTRIG